MAGRKEYIVQAPNGEGHARVFKGGKVPAWAVWVDRGNGWELSGGYSYSPDKVKAARSAKSSTRGCPFRVTRILPASL